MTFGAYLKEERERRLIELEEIARATKIKPSLLSAIETDTLDDLPPLPIMKGFLRSYAQHVGLPPEDTILRYIVFRESTTSDSPDPAGERNVILNRIRTALARLKGFLTGTEGYQVF